MTDPEKPKFQAGATIQIDLDQVQLVDPDAPPAGDASTAPRKTAPPPLPPTAMPEVMASAATPAPARPTGAAGGRAPAQKDPKLALHIGIVVGVVVLAVVAALVVASRVRGGSPAEAASASPSGAPLTGGASAAPSSSGVLTIPPIEVR